MKLLFSEAKPDYLSYQFPYVVWAFPESGERPSYFFQRGFLPSAKSLDRFYLCRQVRVDLGKFALSSENRRVLRKNAGLSCRIVPRAEFVYTEAQRAKYQAYCDRRFGLEKMSHERLDELFGSAMVTHVAIFTEEETAKEVGCATLYLERPECAFYSYAFYDCEYLASSLGMFMMTWTVDALAREGFRHLYLGTCYSESALYKTQFRGCEFFNGFRWSEKIGELKNLLKRQPAAAKHYLEDANALAAHYLESPAELAKFHGVRIAIDFEG